MNPQEALLLQQLIAQLPGWVYEGTWTQADLFADPSIIVLARDERNGRIVMLKHLADSRLLGYVSLT